MTYSEGSNSSLKASNKAQAKPAGLVLWWRLIRPHTLSASIAPSLLSQVLAYQYSAEFSWLLAVLIFACALGLQMAVNIANDYFDFKRGIDGEQRLGPDRLLAQGLVSETSVKWGFIVCLLFGVAMGVWVLLLSHWQLGLAGIVCVLAVLAYSGGPRPLASNGMGELAVFIVFGPIAVAGAYYAQAGSIPGFIWPGAFACGALAAAIMLVNNIRDMASDAVAGKRTLALSLGESVARGLYLVCILSSLVAVAGLTWALSISPYISSLLLPLGAFLLLVFYRRNGQQLNRQLAQTAQFKLLWVLLLCADIILSAYLAT